MSPSALGVGVWLGLPRQPPVGNLWPDFPEIADIGFHYRAAELELSDSDLVSSWEDISGNGNTISQSTTANKPIYKAEAFNGFPCVRFDGTDDYLINNAVNISDGVGFSFVVVYRQITTTNYGMLITSNGNAGQEIRMNATNSSNQGVANGGSGGVVTGSLGAVDTYRVGHVKYQSGGLITLYHNEVEDSNSAAGGAVTPTTCDLWIGKRTDGFPVNADIAEIIGYKRNLIYSEYVDILLYVAEAYGV